MKKKLYVVGNWKMHKTAREAVHTVETLLPLIQENETNIWLAVPFTTLPSLSLCTQGSHLVIGAQNMSEAREGAFTGEISSLMLKEFSVHFVLLGHSERRSLFADTDSRIHKKVVRALQDDLIPILCIGETLHEKEAGSTEDVLKRQISSAFHGIALEDLEKVMIAYEPVWAIGTGHSATAELVQEICKLIRAYLVDLMGKKGLTIPLLYGGSVRPENTSELLKFTDIDGFLVGAASLDPNQFASIAQNVQCHKKAARATL